ncbi:amidase [Breoghania sp.]|uniref:amidase n=1 Tax=Breoghania sp. TaxID=2065378 RepID=UPI0026056FF0|nr:amidase [Breoghania sp.]MDJ0933106.1 amidase [Breoghania sp.]
MHELAFGVTGVNHFLGTPLNPKWLDRIPGGSSSGSAALMASGSCDFAIGADTSGSVRMPACCCGVYGMKPTFGRISRKGAIPKESSLDCIGPFARSAEMLTRAMSLMDPTFEPLPARSEFVLKRIVTPPSPEMADAFDKALAPLQMEEIGLPSFDDAYEAGLTVINAEVAESFGDLARQSTALDETVRARILAAADTFSSDALKAAETVRSALRAEIDAAFETADALVLPTMPVVPPTLADATDMRALIPLTAYLRPFNLSGHPAITIPITTANGLPAGIQIVGRMGGDEALCAVAEGLARILVSETQAQAEDNGNGQ